MLIDLFNLVDGSQKKMVLSPKLDENQITYQGESLEIKDYNFEVEFRMGEKKHIDFKCVGSLTLQGKCDLCLEPVDIEINIDERRDLDMNKTDEDRIEDLDESAYINDTKFDFDIFNTSNKSFKLYFVLNILIKFIFSLVVP